MLPPAAAFGSIRQHNLPTLTYGETNCDFFGAASPDGFRNPFSSLLHGVLFLLPEEKTGLLPWAAAFGSIWQHSAA